LQEGVHTHEKKALKRRANPKLVHSLLLRKLGVGLLAVLNVAAKTRFGVDFPTLLLEDEEKALAIVEEVRGSTLVSYFEKHIIPLVKA
jgi:hypothetical protein